MTRVFLGQELAERVKARFPDMKLEWAADVLWVQPQQIEDICQFLRDEPGLQFSFLNSVSAVDYVQYFEIIYHLTSLEHNHGAVVKTRVVGREAPALPSVTSVWRGADFQEREIYDLMGVHFEGHPNLKRIMLWEGFPGHPQRKDFEDAVQY